MDDRVGLGHEHGHAHGVCIEQIERDRLRTQGPEAGVVSGRPEGAGHLVPTLDQLRHDPGANRSARACYEDSHRLTAQWEVVEAFLAAARDGDFDALVAVLDPDVVLRADGGPTGLSQHLQGAETVAGQALMWSRVDLTMRRALINGAAGMVTFLHGEPFSIAAVTIKNRKIVEIDFLADPGRIAQLDLTFLRN
jgi:hypothetical protein